MRGPISSGPCPSRAARGPKISPLHRRYGWERAADPRALASRMRRRAEAGSRVGVQAAFLGLGVARTREAAGCRRKKSGAILPLITLWSGPSGAVRVVLADEAKRGPAQPAQVCRETDGEPVGGSLERQAQTTPNRRKRGLPGESGRDGEHARTLELDRLAHAPFYSVLSLPRTLAHRRGSVGRACLGGTSGLPSKRLERRQAPP